MLYCEKWGHLAKNCWYRKDNGATKDREEGANLARQDSNGYEDMVVMAAVVDDMSIPKSGSSTQDVRIT